MSTVFAGWTRGVAALGGDPDAAGPSAHDLERRYAEPHRSYHTARHIAAVLGDVAWLAGQLGVSTHDASVVTLAACAHDVVYDARPGDDERASAAWAVAALTAAGVEADAIARVEALVMMTVAHRADPSDVGACVLLDADLAILAAPPATYAEYVAGVRSEYAAVPDDGWRVGRAHMLESLVTRADLYLTEPGRRRWDAAARRNVAVELADLREPGRTGA